MFSLTNQILLNVNEHILPRKPDAAAPPSFARTKSRRVRPLMAFGSACLYTQDATFRATCALCLLDESFKEEEAGEFFNFGGGLAFPSVHKARLCCKLKV
jgi:hypothetical protein